LIEKEKSNARSRILSDSEVPIFWNEFEKLGIEGAALKLVLLTGQRPGEVIHLRKEHIKDGWWEMPGRQVPELDWPGTKNAQDHRVWIPQAARELIDGLSGNQPLAGLIPSNATRDINKRLEVKEKVTPHDLRRTHGSTITALHFGRDAMNRIQNHKEGGITDTYDRHSYAEENKKIMEAAANRIMSLVNGDDEDSRVIKVANFTR
jgi:integrase